MTSDIPVPVIPQQQVKTVTQFAKQILYALNFG